jgi:hypothetical protein
MNIPTKVPLEVATEIPPKGILSPSFSLPKMTERSLADTLRNTSPTADDVRFIWEHVARDRAEFAYQCRDNIRLLSFLPFIPVCGMLSANLDYDLVLNTAPYARSIAFCHRFPCPAVWDIPGFASGHGTLKIEFGVEIAIQTTFVMLGIPDILKVGHLFELPKDKGNTDVITRQMLRVTDTVVYTRVSKTPKKRLGTRVRRQANQSFKALVRDVFGFDINTRFVKGDMRRICRSSISLPTCFDGVLALVASGCFDRIPDIPWTPDELSCEMRSRKRPIEPSRKRTIEPSRKRKRPIEPSDYRYRKRSIELSPDRKRSIELSPDETQLPALVTGSQGRALVTDSGPALDLVTLDTWRFTSPGDPDPSPPPSKEAILASPPPPLPPPEGEGEGEGASDPNPNPPGCPGLVEPLDEEEALEGDEEAEEDSTLGLSREGPRGELKRVPGVESATTNSLLSPPLGLSAPRLGHHDDRRLHGDIRDALQILDAASIRYMNADACAFVEWLETTARTSDTLGVLAKVVELAHQCVLFDFTDAQLVLLGWFHIPSCVATLRSFFDRNIDEHGKLAYENAFQDVSTFLQMRDLVIARGRCKLIAAVSTREAYMSFVCDLIRAAQQPPYPLDHIDIFSNFFNTLDGRIALKEFLLRWTEHSHI